MTSTQALRYSGILLLLCIAGAMCWAAEPRSQDGLPPELTIPDTPSLDQQLRELQAMAAAEQDKNGGGGGFLDGVRGFFSGGGKVRSVPPEDIVAHATEARGQTVRVSGIYRDLGKGQGQFVYDGGVCPVSVPESVILEGLKAGELDGKPITVEGVVEVNGLVGLVRAIKMQPCLWLAQMRIARIQERLGRYSEALETYNKAGQAASAAGSPFAAFAKTHAARIAYDELRDVKKAKNLYAAAWNPFTPVDRRGKPLFYTWVPREDGSGWDKLGVADAIGEPLDTLSSAGLWYRVMAFFVDLSGGVRWLGILMISVLSRILIWPLTKKQLSSAEAMKRLQPQIKALQERYVDDKQKFQEEFWKLCQQNGVNPLGGCLPMIIQIPILMVLWYGIRDYIVQFNGHGFLWVRNLAAPDTVLLVAYTISMVFFQKMTQKLQPNPTMTDQQAQQQQMMTYMMPLMFFFFFKGFPAAFLLYWLATNIVYFVQQFAYTRAQARKHVADGTESLLEAGKPSPKEPGGMVKVLSTKGPTGEHKHSEERPAAGSAADDKARKPSSTAGKTSGRKR
ncbi:MAG: membrane protein insertase YidC [Armatimonadetes bacterium]|nr:membrane protein insertase YidC [Armatimonadota bacterium]